LSTEILEAHSYISGLLFTGGVSGSIAWGLHGAFYPHLLSKMAIGEDLNKESNILQANISKGEETGGSNLNIEATKLDTQGSKSESSEVSKEAEQVKVQLSDGSNKVITKTHAEFSKDMAEDLKSLNQAASDLAKELEGYRGLPFDEFHLTRESSETIVNLLMIHGKILTRFFIGRMM
jgi:hypothetical protein